MSGSHRFAWLSATAAFVMIGCTWAFAIARYGGPDEPAHIIRSAAVAHGDVVGQPVNGLEPGYRQVTVPAALASGDPSCYRHSETTTADCALASTGAGTARVATSAGASPPWYYAIVGLIVRLLSDGRSVLAYRMAAVLLCACVLGHAVARSGRYGGGAWMLAALTPSAWFLVGVVGTSGIELALVMLAVVEAVGRFHHGREESLGRVTVPLAGCLLLRPAAFIDIVLVALVLLPTLPRPFTRRSLAWLVGPFAIVGVASLAWNHWTNLVFRDRRTSDSNTWVTTLDRSLHGIPKMAHQAIGALGWNEFFAPNVAQVIWVATLAVAVWWVVTRGSARWWHLGWIAAGLLLPTVIDVFVHRQIGAIWQGRYSIMFAMGGVVFAARASAPTRRIGRGLVIAGACAEVLTLWQTLRRYMVGLDGSFTLQHASWHPPLDPWLLIAINAAAIAWLGVVALGSREDVGVSALG